MIKKTVSVRKDSKGSLIEVFKGKFSQCNILLMKKGSVWGGHYHQKTEEYFYLIDGKIKLRLNNLKNRQTKEKIYIRGDFFTIQPNTIHKIEVIESTKCLVLYSKVFSEKNPDIFH